MARPLILIIGVLTCSHLWADPPHLPKRDEVYKNFERVFKADPKNYFAGTRGLEKKEYDKCQEGLQTAKEKFRAARDSKTLNETQKHKEMDSLRPKLVDLLRKCGECTAEFTPLGGTRYGILGVCYNKDRDAKALDKGYDNVRTFLPKVSNYSRHGGGFRYLLSFKEVVKGQKDGYVVTEEPEKSQMVEVGKGDPTLAHVAVKGLFGQAFSYVIETFLTHRLAPDDAQVKDSLLLFQSKPSVQMNFTQPEVKDDPNGRPQNLLALESVTGSWFADNQGYAEYESKADFGRWAQLLPESGLRSLSYLIVTDTIWHLFDKVMFPPNAAPPAPRPEGKQ